MLQLYLYALQKANTVWLPHLSIDSCVDNQWLNFSILYSGIYSASKKCSWYPNLFSFYAYACCLLIVSSRYGKMSISCFETKSSLSYHYHQLRREPNFNPLETGAHVMKVENEVETRSRKISRGKLDLVWNMIYIKIDRWLGPKSTSISLTNEGVLFR